jgi:hypothetical protein
MDPSLDFSTFLVFKIVLGNLIINVPTNRTYYQTRVSLGPPTPPNVVADITAGADVQHGSLFWTMNAIDLNTGQLVTDTQEGVLPPNTTNNVGAAYVTYSIKPRAGVPTGTLITNQASIVFDINDPIPTDTTTNTVDAVSPTSYVLALPPLENSPTFPVAWVGTDDPGGSGVANFTIFFSDNGGPYQVWLSSVATNFALFTGAYGHMYAFYSIAQDNSGNLEAPHASPDAATVVATPPVITPVPDQTILPGAMLVITNSATDATYPPPALTFSLDASDPAGISLNTNGLFVWTPTCAQSGTTNLVTLWVTAAGSPPLSNLMSFFVTVPACVNAGVGSTVVQTGQSACVPVNLLSTVGLTNLSFTLTYPTNRFSNWAVTSTNAGVGKASVQTIDSAHSIFSFTSTNGQVLQGPAVAGSICFQALSGPSAFLPLTINAISGVASNGSLFGNGSGQPGLVVVLGAAPLLQASRGNNSLSLLTLYGNLGSNYVVQSTTNLAQPGSWQPAYVLTMTNLTQTFTLGGGTNSPPAQFFRAYQSP